MQFTIDRIEGDIAVVEFEDMTTAAAPLRLFPGAKEGDIYNIVKDESGAAERRDRIQDKFNRLKGTDSDVG